MLDTGRLGRCHRTAVPLSTMVTRHRDKQHPVDAAERGDQAARIVNIRFAYFDTGQVGQRLWRSAADDDPACIFALEQQLDHAATELAACPAHEHGLSHRLYSLTGNSRQRLGLKAMRVFSPAG
jgi:hypothetical protein